MAANSERLVLLLVCVFSLSFSITFFTMAEMLSDTYEKITGVNYQLMGSLMVQTPSILSCAASCTHNPDNCSAFLYDPDEATCFLGVTISTSGTALEGNLSLFTPRCRLNPGFNVVLIGSSEYCLHFSGFETTYHEARNICQSYGARLWKCDSQLKLDVLRSRDVIQTWVGLDDMGTEGTYVWSDGEVLTSQEMNELFSYPPDDFGSNEDCCEYYQLLFDSLNDRPCETLNKFVCEYP